MTVDHTTDSGLLCLGGGTGIAPIKALVEDVAEHGERRPRVEVFYGARITTCTTSTRCSGCSRATHGLPCARSSTSGRISICPTPYAGTAVKAYDAYLSGPPGMIRSGVDALRAAGIPSDRIRHDSVEELVAAGD